MTTIAPWRPKREPVSFLRFLPGRTSLPDVLVHAEAEHVSRVLLVGPPPGREWFMGAVPEPWSHGSHHLDHDTPTGRYVHAGAGVTVEVRRAAEWFGERELSTAQATAAWVELGILMEHAGTALFRSPGATGTNLWLAVRKGDVPDPLDDDTASLIRRTSPQHRIELMPHMDGEQMPSLWVLDGRWMYAALTRGLGTGPATWLRGRDADELLDREPFVRGRFLVRWKAPDGWSSIGWPGMLMAQDADGGWSAPPEGEAWVDSSELYAARRMDWQVTVIEGFRLHDKGRPLDAWTDRLVRARSHAETLTPDPDVNGAVAAAVRAILLHTIGSFHSIGTVETTVTDSPMSRPEGEGWEAPEDIAGRWLWRRRREGGTPRQNALRHPELSSQVWGRAHARILDCPTGDPNHPAGALFVAAGTLVGIYGDAIMTTRKPSWAALDDGKPGRLRVKGHLCGPVTWPSTARERDDLTRQAQAAGVVCGRGCS